jgi:hypothetical protein
MMNAVVQVMFIQVVSVIVPDLDLQGINMLFQDIQVHYFTR